MSTPDIIMKQLDTHVNRQFVRLASLVHSEITQGTPVDTGYARANWIPSIGTPDDTNVRIKGRPNKQQVAVSTARSQKGLLEVVARFRYTKLGSIFITNNVHYVPILDKSHKRAKGFINKGIKKALQRFIR